MQLLRENFGKDFDTLATLVFYRILQGGANSGALDWYDGSWTKSLFPDARLSSQRLSDFVKCLCDEKLAQTFFRKYLEFANCSNAVLIDSTGLPNAIDMSVTAVSNHAGQVNNEARFILVHDRETNLPLYYRYIAGNIVDVSTLTATLKEMSAFNVKVDYALLDAGYCSKNNITELFSERISFITRLGSNRKLYTGLIDEHLTSLKNTKYLVKYRERLVYIMRVNIDLYGYMGYAYVAVDEERHNTEFKKYMLEELVAAEKTPDEMDKEIRTFGTFILVSSEKLEPKDVLPIYYKRQAIEQMFDVSKNCAEILPLRVHNESAFRGHLLISFIAMVACQLADRHLTDTKFSLQAAMNLLRNLKVKVFPNAAVVQEPTKRVKEVARLMNVVLPKSADCGQKKTGN
jgi:transposase